MSVHARIRTEGRAEAVRVIAEAAWRNGFLLGLVVEHLRANPELGWPAGDVLDARADDIEAAYHVVAEGEPPDEEVFFSVVYPDGSKHLLSSIKWVAP